MMPSEVSPNPFFIPILEEPTEENADSWIEESSDAWVEVSTNGKKSEKLCRTKRCSAAQLFPSRATATEQIRRTAVQTASSHETTVAQSTQETAAYWQKRDEANSFIDRISQTIEDSHVDFGSFVPPPSVSLTLGGAALGLATGPAIEERLAVGASVRSFQHLQALAHSTDLMEIDYQERINAVANARKAFHTLEAHGQDLQKMYAAREKQMDSLMREVESAQAAKAALKKGSHTAAEKMVNKTVCSTRPGGWKGIVVASAVQATVGFLAGKLVEDSVSKDK